MTTGRQQGRGLGEGLGLRLWRGDLAEVALPKVQVASRLPALSIHTAWQMPLRNVSLRGCRQEVQALRCSGRRGQQGCTDRQGSRLSQPSNISVVSVVSD